MAKVGYLFRFISKLMILLSYLIWPFIKQKSKKNLIPRRDDPIFANSAKEIAIKIRRKQVSVVSVIESFISRQKEINPVINAVVEDRYADALKEAKAADEFLSKTQLSEDELEKERPLLGVPFTVKENLSLKGMSFAVGALSRSGMKAKEDGESVDRIRKAGGIPLCVSNTPEFCLSVETYNLITGATNNPYNGCYNSGGSSGGEGALIGSGASVFGLGSDIAGSIRIPSAFNGIFGHKPSRGISSIKGHFPSSTDPRFVDHLVVGPMVRYAEDLPLLMKILAGPNAAKLNLDEPVNLSKIKVFYMEDCGNNLGIMPVQQQIKDSIKTIVEHFKTEWEIPISDVKFNELEYSAEAGTALHFALKDVPGPLDNLNTWSEIFKAISGKSKFPFNTLLYGLVEDNKTLIPGTTEDHVKLMNQLRDKMMAELGTNGIFLYPSYPTSALPHYGSLYGSVGVNYLVVFNILGFPATNVPVGFDEKGMPVGIQVVAAPNQDRLCFAVAKELETLFGGWKSPY